MVDPELHRDSDVVVTALNVKFNCRHCPEWFVARYDVAKSAFDAHMEMVHSETDRSKT